MDTDEHRSGGPESGLALIGFGLQSGERIVAVEKGGIE
jgi:hypothetical protein